MTSAIGPELSSLGDNMYDALLIYEILDCIIVHLAQDLLKAVDAKKAAASQRALAALARTCRAFSGPALGTPWSRLDSLEPLLCLRTKASYDNRRTVVW